MIEIDRYWCFLFPLSWAIPQIFGLVDTAAMDFLKKCSVPHSGTETFKCNIDQIQKHPSKDAQRITKKDSTENENEWDRNVILWRNKSNVWCSYTNYIKFSNFRLDCCAWIANTLYPWSHSNFDLLHHKSWCVYQV